MTEEFILGSPSAWYILTRNFARCLAVVTPTGTSRLLRNNYIKDDQLICAHTPQYHLHRVHS
jgi:hypothetical protein